MPAPDRSDRRYLPLVLALLLAAAARPGGASERAGRALPALPFPILFVTQVPNPAGFGTAQSTFGNHLASVYSAPRGGGLWIRYPDGSLKNLTAAAGLGSSGFQDARAIAVRDPAVHWDGERAVFSMVVGAPARQYEVNTYYWQLYEVTGLAPADTPVVTRVPGQPAGCNNTSPVYDPDDRILFISDRSRTGEAHLYPQLDEYELAAANSGLWRLDPASGDLRLLEHSPSGNFDPIVDSFGRVVFTRWDHLERDQLADADAGPVSNCYGGTSYGTFDYSDESAAATYDLSTRVDVFPEPRSCRNDLLAGTHLDGHGFNHFLPWMMNPEGTEAETLNHVGRHELHGYLARTFNNDPNVEEYYGQYARFNPRSIYNFFEPSEDPLVPGDFFGIDAPEFGTHAAGQVVLLHGAPGLNPDRMAIDYLTHRETAGADDAPPPEHSGLYRDPLALSDGTVVAVHTPETRADANTGSREQPGSRYDFRMKALTLAANGYFAGGEPLTPGIVETVSYWDPDVMVTWSGAMWELYPVEVRPRPRPERLRQALPDPERQVFREEGVDPVDFEADLIARDLALLVSRNVTTRDHADRQQPRNLRVAGGGVETVAGPGTVYDVAHIQFFQGDQLRGHTGSGSTTPLPGRRVLARPLHDPAAVLANPANPGAPEGSQALAPDGSMAALVPARRAMTWQLVDGAGTGVVRERFWLSFRAGEMRVCASCHGVNERDQAGNGRPANSPEALRRLLRHWVATRATACAPLPAPVAEVRMTKSGAGARIEWTAGGDADHYNVWKVTSGEKALVPFANRMRALLEPSLRAACAGVPAAAASCTDPGPAADEDALVLYQVRGACADDTEGVADPY